MELVFNIRANVAVRFHLHILSYILPFIALQKWILPRRPARHVLENLVTFMRIS